MNSNTKVLVFGASSYIGSYLCPALEKIGFSVRASARQKRVLTARNWHNIDIIQADALRPDSIRKSLKGIDYAFYLVHSMAAGKDFANLDRQAALNFASAARKSGIKRIFYLGSLIPENASSEHFLSRRETGDILRSTQVPVTEVRAGIIVGPGSAAFEVMRDLVNHLPILVTPKWVLSKTKPISLDNVIQYFSALLVTNDQGNKIYEIGGPDVLTYEQMMLAYAKYTKKNFRLFRLPLLSPRMVSHWLRIVTSVPSKVAKSLIEGLKNDVIANDELIKEKIPLTLKTFDESLKECFEIEANNAKVAHWVNGSIACRNYDPNYSFYAKKAQGVAITDASSTSLYKVVTAFGGSKGYYYANTLWYIRRAIDWVFGGPSFRRPRRHPVDARVGDVIDSWRVIAAEPPNVFTLKMELKGPGSGVLEFIIRDKGSYRSISANAYWHPAGPFGLMYWYACLPAHLFLFKGLTKVIANLAEKTDLELEGKKNKKPNIT